MQTLSIATVSSPLGPLTVVATEEGICSLRYGAWTDLPPTLSRSLLARGPVYQRSAVIREFERELRAYCRGQLQTFSSPLVWMGTDFQQSVWQALRRIPYGQTQTYQQVASAIGLPGATQAVGGACGANPLPIIVPCHRVLAAGGKLGGYSGGLETKVRLLQIEGVVLV